MEELHAWIRKEPNHLIRLNMTNSFIKNVFLFLLGGFSYVSIELLTRGRSHISMLIAGGICFLGMGNLDKLFPMQ